MKHLSAIAVLALAATCADAQVIRTRTTVRPGHGVGGVHAHAGFRGRAFFAPRVNVNLGAGYGYNNAAAFAAPAFAAPAFYAAPVAQFAAPVYQPVVQQSFQQQVYAAPPVQQFAAPQQQFAAPQYVPRQRFAAPVPCASAPFAQSSLRQSFSQQSYGPALAAAPCAGCGAPAAAAMIQQFGGY